MIASAPRPMPMAEFAAKMLGHYATLGRSASTLGFVRQVLNELVERTDVHTTADLDDAVIDRFCEHQPPGQSQHTFYGKLSALRAVFNRASQLGLIGAPPRFPFIPQPGQRKPQPRPSEPPLDREDVVRVLADLQRRAAQSREVHRLYVLAATAASVDLIKREVLCLRREDCDLAQATFRVRRREKMRRGTRPPIVRIPAHLLPILARWLECNDGSEWVFPNNSGTNHWGDGKPGSKPVQQLAAAGRAVGVAGFTFDRLHRFFREHNVTTVDLGPAPPTPPASGFEPARRDDERLDVEPLQQLAAPIEVAPVPPPPRRRHTRVRDITIDIATRLMAHLLRGSATWEGHRLYALVALVLFTGLRLGEALGLRREDCDLEGRTLRIGDRPIPEHLNPEATQVLADWLAREDLGGSEWVFPGTLLVGPWWGGRPGQKPLERLQAAAQEVGLGHVTFEALRHLWLSCNGRVELGEEFRSLRPPERIADGPRTRRPGPRPGPGGPRRAHGPRAWREARETRETRVAFAAIAAPVLAPASPSDTPTTPVLELPGPYQPPVIRGVTQPGPLPLTAFNILTAMVKAGCLQGKRLTEAEMAERSGHPNPVRTLRKLRKQPVWAGVILFPGRNGFGGYGLAMK